MNSREFYLSDFESTLFPFNMNRMLVDLFSKEVQGFILSDVLTETGGFQNQHRVNASKRGWYLRPTVKLDPVAEFFLYDFVYRNRALFRESASPKRRSLGFTIVHGQPTPALHSYTAFKKAIADYKNTYFHYIYLDISSYFNHLYHHDLVHWAEALGTTPEDSRQFGRFLREIVGGRSVDCLPQGLYPSKMIGAAFLNFIEASGRIRSAQTLRLMDDIWLFDDDEKTLTSDFIMIQTLLSSRGLSINERKALVLPDNSSNGSGSIDIDAIKISLLKRRREEIGSSSSYGDASEDDTEDLEDLTEEEQKYLIDLLDGDDVQEEDAELVLTLMRDHSADVIEFLPDLVRKFPGLSKRIYYFCKGAEDESAITEILMDHLDSNLQITEFQMFWFARMAEDYLLKTPKIGDLLIALYEHEYATDISRAKILEIPEKRFGFVDLREEQLKTGNSGWLAWTAAVGCRKQPKSQRNQLLKYFRKLSPMNRLIGEFVESSF